MPIASILGSGSSVANSIPTATPPIAASSSSSVPGALNNLFTRTINGVAEIGPNLLNAFVVSRATRDQGVSNVLAASQAPQGLVSQDPVSTAPAPTAAELGQALNQSGGPNINANTLLMIGGGLLLVAAIAR
ncbi:MAG: hypothetical protein AAFY83_11720 [Pseudomonadota bacterium]